MKEVFFKRKDSEYRYLRTGPKNGWEMSPNLYAKCPQCGYFLSLDPMKSESCPCGNLIKISMLEDLAQKLVMQP